MSCLSNCTLADFSNNDITVSWEANQSAAVVSLPTSHAELRLFMESPPTDKARIDAKSYNKWKRVVPENILKLFFVGVHTGDVCQGLDEILTTLLFHPAIIPGSNEDSYHGRVDQCVLTFLDRFASSLQLRRNTSQDASSTLLKRPDVVGCIPGKGCFFRGEEKKIGSNEDPKSELYEKLQDIWPFPGLGYVLGYHSAGCLVTFSKVVVGNAFDICGPLDLANPTARLQCWNVMRNVARLLNFMIAHPGPSQMPHDMDDLVKEGGGGDLDWRRNIKFSGGHVVKEYFADTEALVEKQGRVESVISVIKSGIDGVQPIVSHKISKSKRQRTVKFYVQTVLGEQIARVETTAQLRSLVEFLLRTVRVLHSRGITHRDIRLPNIVRTIPEGKFALIDWDDSVLGIQDLNNSEVAHLESASHAPEISMDGGQHDSSVDLWSIGHLIHCYQEHADTQLTMVMNRLLVAANERPSDDQACRLLGIE